VGCDWGTGLNSDPRCRRLGLTDAGHQRPLPNIEIMKIVLNSQYLPGANRTGPSMALAAERRGGQTPLPVQGRVGLPSFSTRTHTKPGRALKQNHQGPAPNLGGADAVLDSRPEIYRTCPRSTRVAIHTRTIARNYDRGSREAVSVHRRLEKSAGGVTVSYRPRRVSVDGRR
jgi:hypothetical protein